MARLNYLSDVGGHPDPAQEALVIKNLRCQQRQNALESQCL